jgi:hypothetical protein
MLTTTRGVPQAISLDALKASSNTARSAPTTLNSSTTSFAQQLAESLEGYLGQSSTGKHVEIDILPQQGGNSGTRQFIVTVKDPSAPTAVVPTAAPTPGLGKASSPVIEQLFNPMPLSAAQLATIGAEPDEVPITNETDAYWAMQPEEVQALRTIQDPVERGLLAQELSQQGFAIDPNIMLFGWDPYMTMKMRMEEGYTWIPALGQSNIPVSPGLSYPGLPSYDPGHPPPGSIPVSMDFALGLEDTSPYSGTHQRGNAARS